MSWLLRKAPARAAGAWARSTLRSYLSILLSIVPSWKLVLSLVLMLSSSASQGVQILMLVPLMQLVGLDIGEGSLRWISDLVSSVFAFVGVTPTLVTVLGIFVVFSGLQALVQRCQQTFNLKVEQGFVSSLRQRLYRAIANTEWLTFARSRSSDFTHALTIELDRVGVMTNFLLTIASNSIMLSVYMLFTLQVSVAMTALVFLCGAGLLLMLRRKTKAARWTGEEISMATNGLYAAAMEHLSGMKTTKSYGVEERSATLFSGLADQVADKRLDSVRVQAAAGFWFRVGSVVVLSVILYVVFAVLTLPTATVLLLLFMFTRMIPLFASIQGNHQGLTNALPAFRTVMELQERCEAAAEPRAEHQREATLVQGLRFERVSFAYGPQESPALREVNLAIEAGKTTAIVGPSGAGKSTVADLVMGLISPTEGRVLVDGAPLGAERMASWRRSIGYVAQDTFLFNETVRANLLWACPQASDGDLARALSSAAADEFIRRLPDGMETVLGDRGVRLSGGEKQRLALARALLREPSLLILDEATSALDSENEKRIQSAIEGLHGRTTILVITHRLATIRKADTINVLENGRLVESGGWEELTCKPDGRFVALCKAQGIQAIQKAPDGEKRRAEMGV